MPLVTVSLTDLYGTLVCSRILVPDDISKLDPAQLSLHGFRRFVDTGALPMPIFTAISRHLPAPLDKEESTVKSVKSSAVDTWQARRLAQEQKRIEDEARWLWLYVIFRFSHSQSVSLCLLSPFSRTSGPLLVSCLACLLAQPGH